MKVKLQYTTQTVNRLLLWASLARRRKIQKRRKKVWTVEEELVVNCWVEKGCLFKTSSADYKRHDKKAAAREEMKRALHAQLGSVVTGKQTLLYYKNVLAISLWQVLACWGRICIFGLNECTADKYYEIPTKTYPRFPYCRCQCSENVASWDLASCC